VRRFFRAFVADYRAFQSGGHWPEDYAVGEVGAEKIRFECECGKEAVSLPHLPLILPGVSVRRTKERI